MELLRRCDGMVGKLGLFSSNETKEDVSTTNSNKPGGPVTDFHAASPTSEIHGR